MAQCYRFILLYRVFDPNLYSHILQDKILIVWQALHLNSSVKVTTYMNAHKTCFLFCSLRSSSSVKLRTWLDLTIRLKQAVSFTYLLAHKTHNNHTVCRSALRVVAFTLLTKRKACHTKTEEVINKFHLTDSYTCYATFYAQYLACIHLNSSSMQKA